MSHERKIVGFTMVGNEADLLEAFVRHNLRFVDELHLSIDENSVDGSEEIARSLAEEGLPIKIRKHPLVWLADPRNEFLKSTDAWAYIFIDDDEFLWGVSPSAFKNFIHNCEESFQILVPWKTFIVSNTAHDTSDIPRTMIFARRREEPQFFKSIYIRANESVKPVVAAGAHYIEGIKAVQVPRMFLAHYPVRTYEQIVLKYIIARIQQSRLVKYALKEGHGWHLDRGFSRICETDFSSPHTLHVESLEYASKIQSDTSDNWEEIRLEYEYELKYRSKIRPALQTISRLIALLMEKKVI